MDTTTETVTLSAEHLKALRNAHSVSFHTLEEGECYIRATKPTDPGDGFGSRELTVDVPAQPQFTIYEHNGTSGRRTPKAAFWSIMACRFHPEWVTAARFLKAGDKVFLHWTSDTSENLRASGWRTYKFALVVTRKIGKTAREERLEFLLDARTERAGNDFYLTF